MSRTGRGVALVAVGEDSEREDILALPLVPNAMVVQERTPPTVFTALLLLRFDVEQLLSLNARDDWHE